MKFTPITLEASKYLTEMTTFITELRFINALKVTDIVSDVVDSVRFGNVDYGKGITVTFKKKLQPVKDLSETSSALTITKAEVYQETIEIDTYKFIPISFSLQLARDAVLNGNLLEQFNEFLMGLLSDTEKFYFYDLVVNMIMSYVPTQATQTVTINLKSETGLTGADLRATQEWNASEIAKVIRKTANNMKIKSTKFTDMSDVNTAVPTEDLKVYMNDNFETNLIADALATLYHGEKIKAFLPENMILLPTDSMDNDNTNTICWLSHKNKFALADFYKLTQAFTDPSTLYTNTFYHFSFGAGVFKALPCVKFVANYQ